MLHQHHGELVDFVGLHQRHRFEQLVQGPETTRHHHKGLRVLDEHGFAHKEIVEVHSQIHIGVDALLVRQFNPQPDGVSPCFVRALRGSLH